MSDFFAPVDAVRHIHRGCVAKRDLWGGTAKHQRRGFVRVPKGSDGLVTYEFTNQESGIVHYLIKFRLDKKTIYVRCPPYMVELTLTP